MYDFEDAIIAPQSLDEMLTWVAPLEPDEDKFRISYGLGIFNIESDFGLAYIHSGDAIGYFARMAYFPSHKTSISWAVN
ncbi:MAG: hypothetical protein M3512_18360 [Bacteroidota bacterium]|nr:hypothetical protein [Bacteroidota bacterium]